MCERVLTGRWQYRVAVRGDGLPVQPARLRVFSAATSPRRRAPLWTPLCPACSRNILIEQGVRQERSGSLDRHEACGHDCAEGGGNRTRGPRYCSGYDSGQNLSDTGQNRSNTGQSDASSRVATGPMCKHRSEPVRTCRTPDTILFPPRPLGVRAPGSRLPGKAGGLSCQLVSEMGADHHLTPLVAWLFQRLHDT